MLKPSLNVDDNLMVYEDRRFAPVGKRYFQSRNTGPLGVLLAVFFAGLLIPGIQLLQRSPKHPAEPVAASLLIIVAVVGIVWSLAFMARLGVRVTDEGIVVYNWMRRYAIPWSKIASFKFGDELTDLSARELMASPTLEPYVVFTDGHRLVMSGLSATRLPRSRKHVRDLLDELEATRLLAQQKTSDAPAGQPSEDDR